MIRKRNKTYTVQVSWYENTSDGKKRQYYTKGGFKTKKAAEMHEAKIKLEIEKGAAVNENPRFLDYFTNWCYTYRLNGKADNTKRRYSYTIGIVDKYFKNVKIKDISRAFYQDFINAYGKNHAKNTVVKTTRLIKSSLKDAVADGIIAKNPAAHINMVYDKKRSQHVDYLSVEELKTLVKTLFTGLREDNTSRYMILAGIFTGARIGEIMALSWDDIDFNNSTITISKSYDYMNKNIKEPKNASSYRTITAPAVLLEALKMLKNNDPLFVFVKPGRIPDNLTISDSERLARGLPTVTAVNKCLRINLKRAGLNNKMHFHSLRHCHVAYLAAVGVDWYSISKRLGHANLSTTLNVYAYLVDESKKKNDKLITNSLNNLIY